MYKKFLKMLFDIFCSLAFIICFWWLYILIAILIKLKIGSPVIFSQKRPGLNGKIFKIYKFRTMTNEKDKKGNLLPDDKRLTKFGQFLRSTSLDEIPEFYNILKGDMSLIGPRPLLVEYLPYYTKEESKRHTVRPGISGLAQVNGRNALTWEKKFEYDITYVNNVTFLNDMKIIFLTIQKVVKREDISDFKESYVEKSLDEIRNTTR